MVVGVAVEVEVEVVGVGAEVEVKVAVLVLLGVLGAAVEARAPRPHLPDRLLLLHLQAEHFRDHLPLHIIPQALLLVFTLPALALQQKMYFGATMHELPIILELVILVLGGFYQQQLHQRVQ